MKIGNVELKNNVILAPMAGFCNEAFFYLCRKYGASLLCSEMISDKGILYENEKTMSLLTFNEELHPFSVQIFGNDPKELAEAAKVVVEKTHADIIDVNMGCSVPKIYKNGNGVALMKDPNLVFEIVKALKEAVNVPITVKIRLGIDHSTENYIEVAKAAEKAGAAAITLHPRTKSDGFSGKADYSKIKNLKNSVKIPVIASGDMRKPEEVEEVLRSTECDAVMIGRAALGNPFIFKEINDYLSNGKYEKVSQNEKFDAMIEHYNRLIQLKGERIATMEMRTHAAWYVKGMKDSTVFKVKLNEISTKEGFLSLVNAYKVKILN